MSIDLFNESMFVYQDAYTEAVSQGLMTLEDSFLFLEDNLKKCLIIANQHP